ncbi:Alpha/Beta hydrolase protein [Plectosphaerella cucumerina]|uniref:Alpha/Beta hydrolase protein n=1 Tax=Plectosphaerella cucumerina TaxID=40658 RepID=A0A8K0TQY8_9PEZI|nr:Alpha/Beta hydrolase protein [Plectosphaerella cucumerina]
MLARREYVYKVVNGLPVHADVYFRKPASASKSLPIALHFHGGNFTVGSKALFSQRQATKLLDLGFVVVSADYRLCPTVTVYDGPVTDALDAYQWSQTKVPELLLNDAGIEVDGSRVVTFGQSCGATLALLMAASPMPPRAILDLYGMKYLEDEAFHTPLPPPPSGALKFDDAFLAKVWDDLPPPTSGPPPVGPNGPDFRNYRVAWMFSAMGQGNLLKTTVGDGDYGRVDPATLFAKGGFPPTYFIHGTKDFLVPDAVSQRAHKELKEHGAVTELVLVEGAPHGFDDRAGPLDDVQGIVDRGLEFLRSHV